MRCARRDEEPIPGVQGQRRLAGDPHLDGPGDDVADLFTRMNVPAGFDTGRDLSEDLDDLAPRDR